MGVRRAVPRWLRRLEARHPPMLELNKLCKTVLNCPDAGGLRHNTLGRSSMEEEERKAPSRDG